MHKFFNRLCKCLLFYILGIVSLSRLFRNSGYKYHCQLENRARRDQAAKSGQVNQRPSFEYRSNGPSDCFSFGLPEAGRSAIASHFNFSARQTSFLSVLNTAYCFRLSASEMKVIRISTFESGLNQTNSLGETGISSLCRIPEASATSISLDGVTSKVRPGLI